MEKFGLFTGAKCCVYLHGVQGVEGSNPFTPTTKHYKGLQEVILEGLFTGRSGRIEALGSYTDMSLTAARKAQSPQMFAQPDATNDGQYTNGYAISNKKGLHPPFGG